jgi:hypothetical protein
MCPGTIAPGGNRKYTRRILSAGLSSAGKTVFLPVHETCHLPDFSRNRDESSSCHSTMMTFVPSLDRPGSNSKRASAVTFLSVSGTGDAGEDGVGGVDVSSIFVLYRSA